MFNILQKYWNDDTFFVLALYSSTLDLNKII
uniref:Uncharacterized protein n=1 Tax=Anguilla anguilla TaxID=7936 RepID=A0A0E9W497_ANGAN